MVYIQVVFICNLRPKICSINVQLKLKFGITYHSGFGHTEVQAKHVQKGAASVSGVECDLFKTDELREDIQKLNDYKAIIFGSPTYMGSVFADFKAFMDASSKLWFNQGWKDKIAAGFTNSHSLSGDKLNTLVQMAIFAMLPLNDLGRIRSNESFTRRRSWQA